jgi:membrane-bound lytic murein transglycosylase
MQHKLHWGVSSVTARSCSVLQSCSPAPVAPHIVTKTSAVDHAGCPQGVLQCWCQVKGPQVSCQAAEHRVMEAIDGAALLQHQQQAPASIQQQHTNPGGAASLKVRSSHTTTTTTTTAAAAAAAAVAACRVGLVQY